MWHRELKIWPFSLQGLGSLSWYMFDPLPGNIYMPLAWGKKMKEAERVMGARPLSDSLPKLPSFPTSQSALNQSWRNTFSSLSPLTRILHSSPECSINKRKRLRRNKFICEESILLFLRNRDNLFQKMPHPKASFHIQFPLGLPHVSFMLGWEPGVP